MKDKENNPTIVCLAFVHFADNESEIVVTWSTMDDAGDSTVEYGINGYILTSYGKSEKFVDGGAGLHSQHIHKV